MHFRGSEKVKKTPSNLYKKAPAPNHHSSTLSPQPILQTERTNLHAHEKGFVEKTHRRKDGGSEKPKNGSGGSSLMLPEVKGAEGEAS